ncbi:hypothetical protein BC332_19541 [Capsicum chinense]|nr:hypothetical protein BC332_19541 [Capsicum chinense]
MDNPPSFSLGITQLDATVQDIPLGFVPATFDEQDPDWAENRSKHKNDSGMKYRIDKVPPHSLHMKSLCNCAFGKEIKEYFGEDVLGAFRNTIFDIFLNLPRCNWIGQISKCLFMLEIQQDNKDELHVWVQGEILKFTMLEFAIITGLKCTNNIDDYMYTSSSKSALMSSTIPPGKILIKADFKSPVSLDQPLKKKKTVMFEQDHQAVMDDDTYRRGHAVHYESDLYRKTQKNAADKEEIGVSDIQHHHHGEIGVSPQSHQHKSIPLSSKQHEGTSKSSLDGDEIKNYINKCMAELVTLISKIPAEVVKALQNEENKQSQDVNVANKDAGHEDDFENEDCSDLEDLEDVNLTAKEDVNEVKLKNQESTDVTDGKVREIQASKTNAPSKRERKKFRILRSPYISKCGSGSKDSIDFDKKEKLKYAFDGYTINQDLLNELMIDYSQWIIVGLLKTHSAKYTTKSCFFKSYVEKTHTRYYPVKSAVELSAQQDYAESIVVAKNEDFIANIIHGFCMPAGLPWYMVDEERLIRVYDSLSSKRKKEPPIEIQKLAIMLPTYLSDNGFYDKTERTDWPSLEADCGIFVCVYSEILSEGLQVHSCGFDAASQRARYASLLWHYGVKKTKEGYTSDNGYPP